MGIAGPDRPNARMTRSEGLSIAQGYGLASKRGFQGTAARWTRQDSLPSTPKKSMGPS
jgi:hypothetical protein